MRCKRCGAILKHYITDLLGRNYYICTKGLTYLERHGTEVRLHSFTRPCDKVYDELGLPFQGQLAYRSGDKIINAIIK